MGVSRASKEPQASTGGDGDDYLFGATIYVGGPGRDARDASPIIPAERYGCEVIWPYD